MIAVFAAAVCLVASWFWLEFGPSIREARQKEAAFRTIGPAKFDELIELACAFEKRNADAVLRSFGGFDEPAIPAEFRGYGFDRLVVDRGVVEGRVYWLVDSGGFARVDTRSTPLRLLFVKGDRSDIIDLLYEEEPNQPL